MLARFDEADQGVLLIDEAYSLVRGGERDFGREAIDAIVKLIEDRRDRIVVVMAGYPDEMEELIASNPGLRSRFPKVIHFPDYTTDELLAIIDTLGDKGGYRLDPGARGAGPRSGSTRSPGTRASATAAPPATCSSTPCPPRPRGSAPVDVAHRRAAHHAHRRRHPRPGRGAAHRGRPADRYGLTVRRVLAVLGRWAWSSAPCCIRHAIDDDDDGERRRRRRRPSSSCAPPTSSTQCEALGDDVEVRPEAAADTAAALADGTLADDVDAWITSTAWLEVVDEPQRPTPSATREALATSPAVVATAPGRYEAITDLCADDDVWSCLGDARGRRLGRPRRRHATPSGGS